MRLWRPCVGIEHELQLGYSFEQYYKELRVGATKKGTLRRSVSAALFLSNRLGSKTTRFSLKGLATERLVKCNVIYLSTFTSYTCGIVQNTCDEDRRDNESIELGFGLERGIAHSGLCALWKREHGRADHGHQKVPNILARDFRRSPS